MMLTDATKIIAIAILEGITEWLPVSSTGHIMLFERFFPLSADFSSDFKQLFDYVIQLGAIIAVPLFFRKNYLHSVNGMRSTGTHAESG